MLIIYTLIKFIVVWIADVLWCLNMVNVVKLKRRGFKNLSEDFLKELDEAIIEALRGEGVEVKVSRVSSDD